MGKAAGIEVRRAAGKGRGVFALRPFTAGELIERAPVIVIPRDQCDLIGATVLDDYWYVWRAEADDAAIVLGYGLLYNHAYRPNARYVRRFDEAEMDFLAVRAIDADEEICINYNGDVHDTTDVGFEVIP